MVPTWTPFATLVLGLILGAAAGRYLGRSAPPLSSAPPPPSTLLREEDRALENGETQRFGMEDVTGELERRYRGRRAGN